MTREVYLVEHAGIGAGGWRSSRHRVPGFRSQESGSLFPV